MSNTSMMRRGGVLAVVCLVAGSMAGAASAHTGHDAAAAHGSHQAGAGGGPVEVRDDCVVTPLACARTATPVFTTDGRLWLAFATAEHVFVAVSDDRGETFHPAIELTGGPVRVDHGGDARPAIAVGGEGRIVVSWTTMREEGYVGDPWYSFSRDGGETFAPPERLGKDVAGGRFVTLRTAPDGRVFAAWIDRAASDAAHVAGDAYAGLSLAVSWLERGREARFDVPRTLHDHSCECCRLGVDFDAEGRAVLLWRHIFDGGVRDHAISTLRESGSARIHRVSVDDWQIDACPHHGPGLSIDAEGRIHVVWYTEGRRRQGAFYAQSTDGGRSFTAPRVLASGSGRAATRPRVLATRGPQVWLAWREADAEGTRVVAQFSRRAGMQWSPPQTLVETRGAADQPLLLRDAQGRGWLSWLTREDGYRLVPLPGTAGSTLE